MNWPYIVQFIASFATRRPRRAIIGGYLCLFIGTASALDEPMEPARGSTTVMNGHLGNCRKCHGNQDPTRYMIDTAQTLIVFRADNYGFGGVIAAFHRVEGGFKFDPAHSNNVFAMATIRADSVELGDPLLNAVVRERFLNVNKFPTMTFVAKTIESTGPRTAKVIGEFTMMGVTKPVTLDVQFNKVGRHPLTGDNAAGFSATGMIKRSDFGVTLGLPSIGDEIPFEITLIGKNLN